jgi:saccharopine dehydrogenase-like NADP-dependent oxidoreductase
MRILVLGGAGAMAQVVIRDLLENHKVRKVGIADLRINQAQSVARTLRDDRAIPLSVDANDAPSLRKLMRDSDVVVNCMWYQLNLQVMRAAIETGIHYLDLGGLYHMTKRQLEMNESARNADVCCVLGIGSSPGIMNIIGAYAASKMDEVETMRLRSASKSALKETGEFQVPFSIRTILDEFTIPPIILRDEEIREVPPLSQKETFSMPDPIGKAEGYYTIHSELATMPKTLGKKIKNMDFIVAYSPTFTATVSSLVKLGLATKQPVKIHGHEITPYDFLSAMIDKLPKSNEPDLDMDVQRVEAVGTIADKPATVTVDAISRANEKWKIGGGTIGTGSPPSIIAQWLASGQIKHRGVLPPESCIEPTAFFEALRTRGITVVETVA